ncbi:hypothetical protein [uncultured Mucilaginibacter sp.]|uniref:hypothetical protein n=1 Tax=uncultured Mucilaginibacter sp. TaxID=797541 RepID=UPI0025D91C7A|nr:hypothetical protein [uncultured Mucilaginibacter sp.]
MMNKWDTPIDFDANFKIGVVKGAYQNLREISQGGPVVGSLLIDGKQISGYSFGGPSLYQNEYLYVPALIRINKFIGGWGFKLAKINIQNLDFELLGESKDLIFMNKIEDNRLYYFEDISKKKYNYYEI